jgi:subtilisin family serine protease
MNSEKNYLDFLNYCANNKINVKREYDEFDLIVVEIPINENINDFKNKIDTLSFVETSELDILTEVSNTYEFTYDHPYHWYLQNINSREAWDLMNQFPDNEPVEVAIFDTLVDVGHPELIGKISDYSVNVLSLFSSDISPNDYDVKFSELVNCGDIFGDIPYHGTGVAGLVAARNSNNDLMLSAGKDKVKVQVVTNRQMYCSEITYDLQSGGFGSSQFMFIEMLYAVFNNPKCVAITNQVYYSSESIYTGLAGDVITYVTENGRNGKGISFFSGTGNYGMDSVMPINFHPNVYGIGASNALNNKSGFSQWGPGLFMCAPGENIMSLSVRGRWGSSLPFPNIHPVTMSRKWKDTLYTHQNLLIADGTSSSTPILGTVAATMIYVNPNLTSTQVINILSETARKTAGTEGYVFDENGYNNELGYGIVDHEAAVQGAIDLLPQEDYNWINNEPISIEITNISGNTILGDFVNIETTTTFLDTNLILGTEYLTIQFYLCDSMWFNSQSCILLNEYTYSGISEIMLNISRILLPLNYPIGNKTIFAKAQIWDELVNIGSYGYAQDSSIIEISNDFSNFPLNIDINLFGPYASNFSSWSTLSQYGVSWRVSLLNHSNFSISKVVLELSTGDNNNIIFSPVTSSVIFSANSSGVVGIINTNYLNSQTFISSEDEIIANWFFSVTNYQQISQNLPLTFTIRVISATYLDSNISPGPYSHIFPYPGPSSTFTVTQWP